MTLQNLIQFSGRAQLSLVLQTEAAECGLACLAMIANYHGHRVDLNVLRRRHPVSLKGVTLKGLIQTASQMDLTCRPLRFELNHLRELRLPAIVHWNMDHFVVLKSVGATSITVLDPATGERRYTLAEASRHLSGVAVELAPADGFARRQETARLPLWSLWGRVQKPLSSPAPSTCSSRSTRWWPRATRI
jgi:ATP-binding cassette, subfamily B, bacterial CvaB/MchF/RaxB